MSSLNNHTIYSDRSFEPDAETLIGQESRRNSQDSVQTIGSLQYQLDQLRTLTQNSPGLMVLHHLQEMHQYSHETISEGLDCLGRCRLSYGVPRAIGELAKYVLEVERLLTEQDISRIEEGATISHQPIVHLGPGALTELHLASDPYERSDNDPPAKLLLSLHLYSASGKLTHEYESCLVKETLWYREHSGDPNFLNNGMAPADFEPFLKVEQVRISGQRATEKGFTIRFPVEFVRYDGTSTRFILKDNYFPSDVYDRGSSQKAAEILANTHLTTTGGSHAVNGLRIHDRRGWRLPEPTLGATLDPEDAAIFAKGYRDWCSAIPGRLFQPKGSQTSASSILETHHASHFAIYLPRADGNLRDEGGNVVKTWCRPMNREEFEEYQRTGKD